MPKREFSTRVRICVVGGRNVGKSAITVRFLTRRFIGEYESNVERSYEGCLEAGHQTIHYQLKDRASKPDSLDFLAWSSCIAIVYSITDPASFETASQLLNEIHRVSEDDSRTPLIVLVGNKSDLERKRKVPVEKGQRLADEFGVMFWESSASEDYDSVFQPLSSIITRCFIESTSYGNHLNDQERLQLLREMKQPSHVSMTASPIEQPLNGGHDMIESVIDLLKKPWRKHSKVKRESGSASGRLHSSSFSSQSPRSPLRSPKSSFSKMYFPKSSVLRTSSENKRKNSSAVSPQSPFSTRYITSPTSSFTSSSSSPSSSASSISSSRHSTPTPTSHSTSPEIVVEEIPEQRNSSPVYTRELIKGPCSLQLRKNWRKSRSFTDITTFVHENASDLSTLGHETESDLSTFVDYLKDEESILGRDRCSISPQLITSPTNSDHHSSMRRPSANTTIKRSLSLRQEVGPSNPHIGTDIMKNEKPDIKSRKKRWGNIFKG